MTLKFKTNVQLDIDYDSVKPQEFDYESRSSNCLINYTVDFETRDWGIKNILFLAFAQEISFELELTNTQSGESESYSFKIKLKEIDTQLPNNITLGDIAPSLLTISLTELSLGNNNIWEGEGTATLEFDAASGE